MSSAEEEQFARTVQLGIGLVEKVLTLKNAGEVEKTAVLNSIIDTLKQNPDELKWAQQKMKEIDIPKVRTIFETKREQQSVHAIELLKTLNKISDNPKSYPPGSTVADTMKIVPSQRENFVKEYDAAVEKVKRAHISDENKKFTMRAWVVKAVHDSKENPWYGAFLILVTLYVFRKIYELFQDLRESLAQLIRPKNRSKFGLFTFSKVKPKSKSKSSFSFMPMMQTQTTDEDDE